MVHVLMKDSYRDKKICVKFCTNKKLGRHLYVPNFIVYSNIVIYIDCLVERAGGTMKD